MGSCHPSNINQVDVYENSNSNYMQVVGVLTMVDHDEILYIC